MHQVQQDFYTSEMRVQRSLIIFTLVTTVVIFVIRIEDTDRKRHVEDGERSQLENINGWEWIGTKAHKLTKNIANQNVWTSTKNTSTNC